METKNCCVYNATRSCYLSLKVTVADSAQQPLKVLKVLIRGLALDSESGLWLTPLLNAPQMMRLFPFDLVYLSRELRVIQGVELLPEVPFPRFNRDVASALILPLYTLDSTGTEVDDQLIVRAEEEMGLRFAQSAGNAAAAPLTPYYASPLEPIRVPVMSGRELPRIQFAIPRVSFPSRTSAVSQGAGFTVGLNTTWRIANSTVAAVTLESADAAQETGRSENLTAVPGQAAVAERAEADEESATPADEAAARPPAAESIGIEEVPLPVVDDSGAATAEPVVEGELAEPVEPAISGVPSIASALVDSVEPAGARASTPSLSSPVEPDSSSESAEATENAPATESVEEQATLGLQPQTAWIPMSEISVEAPHVPAQHGGGAMERTEAVEELTPSQSDSVPTISSPVTPQSNTRPVTPKADGKEKHSFSTLVKRWLNAEDPPPERRASTRLALPGLVAYDVNSNDQKPHEVRDVSPTGLYLRTEERWDPGELITLTLQERGAIDPGRRVAVQAGAVWWGNDGVGLSFALAEGVEFHPWHRIKERKTEETEAEYFVRELRAARALGFLRRICPPAAEEIRQMLYERISNKRAASAVEIAFKAEELLGQRGNDMLAHPDVVLRILEDGSWSEVDWIQKLWAGLLVTSCTGNGQDKSNLVFVELLEKLTPIHLRILCAACKKGDAAISAGESATTLALYCTAEELIDATGSKSLLKIQQTIGHLSTFGLLAESGKSSYVPIAEKTKTTPTILGLRMHARCQGRR